MRKLFVSIGGILGLLAGVLCFAAPNASSTSVTSPVLTVSGSPFSSGDNTYTAVLTVPNGSPAPTGPVVVTDSGGGTCTADFTGSGTNFSASCTIDGETNGQSVTAAYAGTDPVYSGLSAGPLVIGTGTSSASSNSAPSIFVGGTAKLVVVGHRMLHKNGVLVRLRCSNKACHAAVRLYGHGRVLVQRLAVNVRVGHTSRTLLSFTRAGRVDFRTRAGRTLLRRGGVFQIKMRK